MQRSRVSTSPALRPTPSPARPTAAWGVWLLAFLLVPSWAAPLPEPPQAGRVLSASGETTLVRAGLLSSPIVQGIAVRSGDRLRTATDARLSLRMADDGLLAIEPLSEFHVSSYRFDGEARRSFYRLVRGAVRVVSGAIGKRDPGDFRLSTPTATIGIRGTEFIARETACDDGSCRTGEQPGLAVTVLSGRVVVTSAAGVSEVPAGRTMFFGRGAAPGTPPAQAPTGGASRTGRHAGKGAQVPAPRPDRAAAPASLAAGSAAADAGVTGSDGDWLGVHHPGSSGTEPGGTDLRPAR